MSRYVTEINAIHAANPTQLSAIVGFPVKVFCSAEESNGPFDLKQMTQRAEKIAEGNQKEGVAIRYLKEGATEAQISRIVDFNWKLIKDIKKLEELASAAGMDAMAYLQNNFPDIFELDYPEHTKKAFYNAAYKGIQHVTQVNSIRFHSLSKNFVTEGVYGQLHDDLRKGKSKTRACKHCGARHNVKELTPVSVAVCTNCRMEGPFNTATLDKKRESSRKKFIDLEKKLLEKCEKANKYSPYLYNVIRFENEEVDY